MIWSDVKWVKWPCVIKLDAKDLTWVVGFETKLVLVSDLYVLFINLVIFSLLFKEPLLLFSSKWVIFNKFMLRLCCLS